MGFPHFLLCLAHFCEIHGPSTILCTQQQSTESTSTSSSTSTLSSCESCALVLPEEAKSIVTNMGADCDSIENIETESPSLERSGSLSKAKKNADIDERKSKAAANCYISTKYPRSPQVYTSLTKLVMKCLSVEAVADPSKLLFFGDAANGFCLSKVFSIPDLHARGAERKYAFIVACDSETHILQQWHFISTYISEMISFLQGKVEAVRERKRKDGLDNERYLRRSKNMPRSLVELSGDPEIFLRLHRCGIELLRDIQ